MGQTKRPRKSSSYADPEIEDEELDCWEPETPAAKGKRGGTKAAAGGGARKQQRVVAESQEDAEADEQDEDSSTDEEEEEEQPPPRKKKATAAAAGSKKKKAAAAPKEKKGVRIGAKKAKKIYSLDDRDLAQMRDIKWSNNFFFGHNMLYSPAELEEYARKKHAGSEWFERSLRSELSSQESRRKRKAGYRKEAADAALARVEKYVAPLESLATEQYGDTKLPDSVMVNIMECLAGTRQPGGLRGFAEVARDLANASLANWDCYRAAKSGWKVLGEEAQTTTSPPVPCGPSGYRGMWSFMYSGDVERLPGGMEGGWQWSDFLQNPLDKKHKATEIGAALQVMGLKAKGTKVENAERILGMFNLKSATTVPIQLLRVVKLERSKRLAWDGPTPSVTFERVNKAIDQLSRADAQAAAAIVRAKARGVAYIRDAMPARGYSSIDDLVAAGEAAEQQRLAREAEERAKAAAEGRPAPVFAAPPAPTLSPLERLMAEMAGEGYGEDEFDSEEIEL